MASDEETRTAIEMFDNYGLEGRNLVVNEARPREERPRRTFGGGNRGSRFERGRFGGGRRSGSNDGQY